VSHVWVGPSGDHKPGHDLGIDPALEITPPMGYRRARQLDPSRAGRQGPRRTDPDHKQWYTACYIVIGIGLFIVMYVILAPGRVTHGSVLVGSAGASAAVPLRRPNAAVSAPSPALDVRATCAGRAAGGRVAAVVTVTNHSSAISGYLISVAFVARDGSTPLGTGEIAFDNLAPGRSTRPMSVLGAGAVPATGYTCRLAKIERYASAP
jgi:hypothetical protein